VAADWCIFGATLKNTKQCGLAVGLVVCLLAAGCSSSPQMRRIDSNRAVYEQWPIEVRQAVLDGKAEVGMTPDMVEMALGKPTDIVTRSGTPSTGDDEVWIYRTGGDQMDSGMMYPGGMYPGGMYPGGSGGGIVMSPGRGGGIGIIPPSIGIGVPIGGGNIGLGGGGIGIGGGMGGMGGGMPMPVQRTPVDEREVVFRNGVVYRADPPPEPK
jgi:hypothetical protein